MNKSSNKQGPIEDAIKIIPIISLILDLISDIFQRSPEQRRSRQLRKLRRQYEKKGNPISLEEYERRKQMIENEYDLK